MCVVLLYLSFRPLRLCVTITNLRDDKGRKLKQNVLKGGIEPPDYLKIWAESNSRFSLGSESNRDQKKKWLIEKLSTGTTRAGRSC